MAPARTIVLALRLVDEDVAGAQFLDIVVRAADRDDAGMVEAVAERPRTACDARDRDGHDLIAEQGNERMERTHPAQAGGRGGGFAPAHRLGPREVAHDLCDDLGKQFGGGAPGLVDRGEPDAVALLELVGGEPGLAQEAFERLRRRGGARALQLLAHGVGRQRQIGGDQCEATRGRVGRDGAVRQAGGGERLGEHARKVVARPRLHPRRDFLGQEFEQEVGGVGHAA